jgi:glycolate oxidase iron-sulfur subunit
MLHHIDVSAAGRHGQDMAQAVQTCVHCGFCLPNCPTYQVLGQEADSPRGRIVLMKQVLEGELDAAQAQPHLDRCLGCLACETSCPSGVAYSHLISPYRERQAPTGRSWAMRLRRRLALSTLPYPWRFRWAIRLGSLARRWPRLVPPALKPMISLLPNSLPRPKPSRSVYPAHGPRRGRVALLSGCAQQVLAPEINAAAIEVLTRLGVEVVVPPQQGCCGALAWHVGSAAMAKEQVRRNLVAFPGDVDRVLTTAAGCGSAMHEYPLIMRGEPEEEEAERLAKRCQDVCAYLAEIGGEAPVGFSRPVRIAYHDACHLAHAQRITDPPRQLLRRIPGVQLVPLSDSDLCCGSAGTYNLDQPEIADQLGQRKAKAVLESDCQLVALGNIGCQIQIHHHLQALGAPRPVLHVVQILAAAYRGHAL